MQGQCIGLRKYKTKRRSDWCMVFFYVVQEIWRTQAAQTFEETTEDSADIVKGQHLMISDDIWYFTNVRHESETSYSFRQKRVFELISGYLRKKLLMN